MSSEASEGSSSSSIWGSAKISSGASSSGLSSSGLSSSEFDSSLSSGVCDPNITVYYVQIASSAPGEEFIESCAVTGSLNAGSFMGAITEGDVRLDWNGVQWEVQFDYAPTLYFYSSDGTIRCDPTDGFGIVEYYLEGDENFIVTVSETPF